MGSDRQWGTVNNVELQTVGKNTKKHWGMPDNGQWQTMGNCNGE